MEETHMSDIPALFIIATVLVCILATHSIWAPRKMLVKLSALLTTLLFIPLSYMSMVSLLSKPKPVHLEWWRANEKEATVLGSLMREGHGIYLWLQMADLVEPRSYVLPWNQELALQLQRALREAEKNGTSVQMRLPFEPSLDNGKPKFYALPQPALPPKDRNNSPPEFFAGPAQDT